VSCVVESVNEGAAESESGCPLYSMCSPFIVQERHIKGAKHPQ
jgi:hypothetical protein